jgi:predicted PurR-regulated permease PerM
LFLAFLLHPLHLRLTRRCGGRANLSAATLTIAALIMLVGPVAAMGLAMVSQASDLVRWLQTTMGGQPNQQYRVLIDLPLMDNVVGWLHDDLGVETAQLKSWFAQGMAQLPELLSGLGARMFVQAFHTGLAFVVMLFMLFFLVRDGAGIVTTLSSLVPMSARRRERMMVHIAEVTRAVVFGTGITVLVQGAVVGVAFWVTGLAAPLVFALLAAMLALLPFGGTAFVWIPATFVLAGQGRVGMAIAMLAIGVVSSTIDNVLRPFLIAGGAAVNELLIFVGVLGGAAAFGPVGMVVGPLVLALIAALMRFARESRRRP